MRVIELRKFTNQFISEDGSIVVIPKSLCLPDFDKCAVRVIGKGRFYTRNILCFAQEFMYYFEDFSEDNVIELKKPSLILRGHNIIFNNRWKFSTFLWWLICLTNKLKMLK